MEDFYIHSKELLFIIIRLFSGTRAALFSPRVEADSEQSYTAPKTSSIAKIVEHSTYAHDRGVSSWTTQYAVPAGKTVSYFSFDGYCESNANTQCTITAIYKDGTTKQLGTMSMHSRQQSGSLGVTPLAAEGISQLKFYHRFSKSGSEFTAVYMNVYVYGYESGYWEDME